MTHEFEPDPMPGAFDDKGFLVFKQTAGRLGMFSDTSREPRINLASYAFRAGRDAALAEVQQPQKPHPAPFARRNDKLYDDAGNFAELEARANGQVFARLSRYGISSSRLESTMTSKGIVTKLVGDGLMPLVAYDFVVGGEADVRARLNAMGFKAPDDPGHVQVPPTSTDSAEAGGLQSRQQVGMRDAIYVDSTPKLHVGSSAFEDWFQAQPFAAQYGIKQISRDSYAAGMGDPLVTYASPKMPSPVAVSADARDAKRWRALVTGLRSRLQGPGHGTKLKVLSIDPQFGSETELGVADLEFIFDRAIGQRGDVSHDRHPPHAQGEPS